MSYQCKNILKAAYGAVGTLEGIITAVRCFGASASDIVSLICTVFGFVLPMPVAFALRVVILSSSGYCLIDSIKKICPRLYRAIKKEDACVVVS